MFKNLAMLMAFGFAALGALVLFFEFDTQPRKADETITIMRGQNAFQIANDLKAEGYIPAKTLFLAKLLLRGDLRHLKAGEYDFNGLHENAIIEKLVAGHTVAADVTIIPGWSLEDIGLAVSAGKLAAREDFEAACGAAAATVFKQKYEFLSSLPEGADLEGFLSPDTYELPDGAAADDIVELALGHFGQNFNDQMAIDTAAAGRTVFEVVIMASLLEKEVKTFEDKKIVAGILWKRLESGMPLQVDSTLLYYKVPESAGGIDKESESRYNTYRYAGLPAGPICNPGLESVRAAIYPAESEYWYYLSAPDGTTIFSRNYGDHLINKAKYLDNL